MTITEILTPSSNALFAEEAALLMGGFIPYTIDPRDFDPRGYTPARNLRINAADFAPAGRLVS